MASECWPVPPPAQGAGLPPPCLQLGRTAATVRGLSECLASTKDCGRARHGMPVGLRVAGHPPVRPAGPRARSAGKNHDGIEEGKKSGPDLLLAAYQYLKA